jgi:site-specific recombinase XerD
MSKVRKISQAKDVSSWEKAKQLMSARHPSWGEDIPVFCSYAGTPLNAVTWGDRLELYSKRLGVKIHPYALRHCFALMFLRNGGNAFTLQKMLGHEDMSMTRRYVNLTSQDLQDTHRSASPINSLVAVKKEKVRLIDKGL